MSETLSTNLIKATKSKYYSNKLTVKNKKDTNIINNNNGNYNTSNNNNNNTINTDKLKPEVNNINKLWTTVKELTNTSTKTAPRNIIYENMAV